MVTTSTSTTHHGQEFWSLSPTDLRQFNTTQEKGLASEKANRQLSEYGKNLVHSQTKTDSLSLLISQFKSPIIIIFIFTSILSLFLGQSEDALIVITIVILSAILGFWQEKGATDAINKLLAIVKLKTIVLRDGIVREIPSEDIVPGDIILIKSRISSLCYRLSFEVSRHLSII